MLMYFVFEALLTMPLARSSLSALVVVRTGFGFITSMPQNTLHAPRTCSVVSAEPECSIVTRSPGYARTTTGRPEAPATVLVNVPRYVPPRTQMVSPAPTRPDAPESAVVRSHGLLIEPSFALDPLVETYLPTRTVGAGAVTVTAAESDADPVAATTQAVPTATAVTNPVEFTRTLAVSRLSHVIVVPLRLAPVPSDTLVVSCAVLPATTDTAAGVTSTVASPPAGVETVLASPMYGSAPQPSTPE